MRVFLILFSFFLMNGCPTKMKEFKETKIQYVAETRGYYMSIIIENNKFSVIKERNAEPIALELSEEEWTELINLFHEIDLNTFESLIGATSERSFDKKAFGNLFITKNDKRYKTRGFDHTIPPAQIKSFVDLMIQYSKKQ